MTSSGNTDIMDLDGAMETVEETYEFMLAYAAQGRRTEEDKSSAGIRTYLQRAESALAVIAAAHISGDAAQKFLDVVKGDAAKAGAVMHGEGAYWVVCLADAGRLEDAGYEWAPRP